MELRKVSPEFQESKGLADLESFIGKSITLRSETGYTQEPFDVVVL
ncbi:MAG: hypothetical protein ABEJ96_09510 [Thiohalorhabdaceae bacterium]